jgi:hypothetical protein
VSEVVSIASVLSEDEKTRLAALEKKVSRGLKTYIEVGRALLEIRDARLYRGQHGTFEEYCRVRWDLSARHARRVIDAAHVANVLGPNGPIPTNEAQARELVPLKEKPDALRAAWSEARNTGEPTAAKVRSIVHGVRERPGADGPSSIRRTLVTIINRAQAIDVDEARPALASLESVERQILSIELRSALRLLEQLHASLGFPELQAPGEEDT